MPSSPKFLLARQYIANIEAFGDYSIYCRTHLNKVAAEFIQSNKADNETDFTNPENLGISRDSLIKEGVDPQKAILCYFLFEHRQLFSEATRNDKDATWDYSSPYKPKDFINRYYALADAVFCGDLKKEISVDEALKIKRAVSDLLDMSVDGVGDLYSAAWTLNTILQELNDSIGTLGLSESAELPKLPDEPAVDDSQSVVVSSQPVSLDPQKEALCTKLTAYINRIEGYSSSAGTSQGAILSAVKSVSPRPLAGEVDAKRRVRVFDLAKY